MRNCPIIIRTVYHHAKNVHHVAYSRRNITYRSHENRDLLGKHTECCESMYRRGGSNTNTCRPFDRLGPLLQQSVRSEAAGLPALAVLNEIHPVGR